ncbi:hypothetical protein HPB49_010094 [Dermacentor silvarum]|uniref:Uncharacterized protein n=1 Tax=Dermacentor silvarum TaxID=543639 RepID=A0ACB8C2W4_DERSI|nr:hypothetical protein HPB49_010094 [Dermacentor silvarum]
MGHGPPHGLACFSNPAFPSAVLPRWLLRLGRPFPLCQTRVIQTTQAAPAIDPHFLHLWDARRCFLRRWRRHKLKRNLKARIAALTEEAASYAAHLSDRNWVETCRKAAGQMSSRGTWRLFRSVLYPSSIQGETQRQQRRALHGFRGTSAELADKLRDRYLCRTLDLLGPEYKYSGRPNPELDAPFTLTHLQASLLWPCYAFLLFSPRWRVSNTHFTPMTLSSGLILATSLKSSSAFNRLLL